MANPKDGMTEATSIRDDYDSPAQAGLAGRVNARTLIAIRWIAVAGQAMTLVTSEYLLNVALPFHLAMAAVFASIALNVYAAQRHARQPFLADRDAALYMGYDMLQLATLLLLTGGLENPFVVLLLAPLTVAASTLGKQAVILLAATAVTCFTVLALWALPLPWPGDAGLGLPALYKVGVWAALVLSAGFIAGYLYQVAQAARRLSNALAASQEALGRAQRASAVGALAAAAAHELGSPLGTIAVVAKELARDMPPDSPHAEDVALLQSQAARCRDILAELSRRPGDAGGSEPFTAIPLPVLIETAAGPYRREGIALEVNAVAGAEDGPVMVRETPEVLHGLGNILQNAMQFARQTVRVRIDRARSDLIVTVSDDGQGFPSALLDRLGEPYVSGRPSGSRDAGGNMGLGLFIAQTLLERSGADVTYGNTRHGGAMVAVRWRNPTFIV